MKYFRVIRHWVLGIVLAMGLIIAGCGSGSEPSQTQEGDTMITITSTAFQDGGVIPATYAYTPNPNQSPPLSWTGVPVGTVSFALICDDPDAPTSNPWVHWVIYDIPAANHALAEGQPKTEALSIGATQGVNDWGNIGWDGPAPPSGTHRYYFKIYALDAMVGLPAGSDKAALLSAMNGHILAEGQLVGTYQKL